MISINIVDTMSSQITVIGSAKSHFTQDRNMCSLVDTLNTVSCYDIMPNSCKMLTLDKNLLAKHAFNALTTNGLRAAPLYDEHKNCLIGMLTITDFIQALCRDYSCNMNKTSNIEDEHIYTWKTNNYDSVLSIDANSSLLEAVKILINNHIHRLLVMDKLNDNPLYILTHKRILKFLHNQMKDISVPNYLNLSIESLNIGTMNNIAKVSYDTKVIDAFKLFVKYRVSALPVVDKCNKLTDIYAKFDVMNIADTKSYTQLDITVKEALTFRKTNYEGVLKCLLTESLMDVINKLVTHEVHRLIIVDEKDHVIGILSLSDIFKFIVIDKAI